MRSLVMYGFGVISLWPLLVDSSKAADAQRNKNAVKLNDIKALTFYSGKLTTARRVEPIPQLNCVGGSGCGLYNPESIRCHNSGSSYSAADIEWTCQASLPLEFKLGSTEVVCEGYDNSNDDYILKGSCGLEYRMILTDLGEEKFGKSWFRAADRSRPGNSGAAGSRTDGVTFETFAFGVLFIGVACWIIYAAFFRDRNRAPNAPRLPRSSRDAWFNNNGDGGDDPPPPYDPRPPPSSPYPSSSSKRTYRSSASSSQSSSNTGSRSNSGGQNRGWRPGFWTGLGSGLLAGSAGTRAYNSRHNDSRTETPSRSAWRSEGTSSGGAGLSDSSTRSSPSHSSERHTSTGFGGTRRR